MTNKNKIEIDGISYIKESSLDSKKYIASTIQIVVLNRGWIVIGKVTESASKTIIKDASVIRYWGTTNGLGELAEHGKTDKTKLDSCPDITVETCNIVLTMNCNQSNWS